MRYVFALLLSAVCTISVVTAQAPVAAQGPAAQAPAAPAPAQKPAVPAGQSTSAAKVTYTGCLKPGTAADSWLLENAEIAPAAGASVATAGTSKVSFGLTAKPGENLKPHANHKIEVVGTVSPAAAAAAAEAPAAGATAAPRQTLNVESFKMVSATCP